ncbi:MAG: hypothetical protein QOH91_1819 [Mycobacterium sp.]|nr:hypothetical protein [Mycobacterium sp.]
MTIDTPIREDQTRAAAHRAVWASGDYALMAEEVMAPLGPILVTAIGIFPGQRVLDVAGSGNISLPALRATTLRYSHSMTPSFRYLPQSSVSSSSSAPTRPGSSAMLR